MEKIIGNFLGQANKDFPLDCECLNQLQSNSQMVEILGNIAGNMVVLYGCRLYNAGTARQPGYVFVRTKDHPEGEILYFEGGGVTSGVHVEIADVSVSAQGNNYPKAYTRRWLASGSGSESFSGNSFVDLTTLVDQKKLIDQLTDRVNKLAGEPAGIVKMWAGSNVPDGYLLCDGTQYSQDTYPKLYAAIGSMYNSKYDSSGNQYTTLAGYFRVPDLRGRFVVGHNDSDNDYRDLGSVGGDKKTTLSNEQVPKHVHVYVSDSNSGRGEFKLLSTLASQNVNEAGKKWITSGAASQGSGVASVHGDAGNGGAFSTTSSGGTSSGTTASHENRPPYYTLSYVIKAE